jgi:hypothetical protein
MILADRVSLRRDTSANIPEIADQIRQLVAQVLQECDSEIRTAPHALRKNIVKDVRSALNAALQLPIGRPGNDAVTKADKMKSEGLRWKEIYTKCIVSGLTGDSLKMAQKRLRDAVNSRRRRAKVARGTGKRNWDRHADEIGP